MDSNESSRRVFLKKALALSTLTIAPTFPAILTKKFREETFPYQVLQVPK